MFDGQSNSPRIMPYTRIVGQDNLKLALELNFINSRIGGVLIEGERGTAKSTAVRSFSNMMTGKLPVTLPINATEDRVIGGWQLEELLKGRQIWQEGLLQQADSGFLYIDEVNLLDDHIINLLLDAASTNILVIEREGEDKTVPVSFQLIGTMNPEEGDLRPQLLDRFGLSVRVKSEASAENRRLILQAVLDFEQNPDEIFRNEAEKLDLKRKQIIEAKEKIQNRHVKFSAEIAEICVDIAQAYNAQGHRGEHSLALAAQAFAALNGETETKKEHVKKVAHMALQHRLIDTETRARMRWTDEILKDVFDRE